jgi:hypothetical protein
VAGGLGRFAFIDIGTGTTDVPEIRVESGVEPSASKVRSNADEEALILRILTCGNGS